MLSTRVATLVPLFIIAARVLIVTFGDTLARVIARKARFAVTNILLKATLLHVRRARSTSNRPVAALFGARGAFDQFSIFFASLSCYQRKKCLKP